MTERSARAPSSASAASGAAEAQAEDVARRRSYSFPGRPAARAAGRPVRPRERRRARAHAAFTAACPGPRQPRRWRAARLPSRLLADRRDAPLVALALAHGLVLWRFPHLLVVALGLWWSSNTVAHYAVHRPFFRARSFNAVFSVYLSAVLGIPQELWKVRHLAHHSGVRPRPRLSALLGAQVAAVGAVWGALLAGAPALFLSSYLPGCALGLALCHLHGHYEHARGTISHHGTLYNLLFFNDGYHVEHHRRPGLHWRDLPALSDAAVPASRWPAVMRWLEAGPLERLERLVLRSRALQRFVVACHERALRRLLGDCSPRRVAIVGGGLFPRTALVLAKLLPEARLVLIDGKARHLELARAILEESDGGARLETLEGWFDPTLHGDFDLAVFPLSFQGERRALYEHPPAPVTLVHDWIWNHRTRRSAVVSWLLLKRLNRVDCRVG